MLLPKTDGAKGLFFLKQQVHMSCFKVGLDEESSKHQSPRRDILDFWSILTYTSHKAEYKAGTVVLVEQCLIVHGVCRYEARDVVQEWKLVSQTHSLE